MAQKAVAQKGKAKARRPAVTKAVAGVAASDPGRPAKDNALLREQLAAAELRIAVLERQRDEALNRIEWVIDSINSLTESMR
jgi:hypothetical protein